jgi:hypothetical protein
MVNSVIVDSPAASDAQSFTQKVLYQSFIAKDWYRMNANSNGNLSVADVFLVYAKRSGLVSTWPYSTPNYRIFTSAQWSVINSSSINLTSTYPGVQSLTTTALTSGGTTNIYIVRTGLIK